MQFYSCITCPNIADTEERTEHLGSEPAVQSFLTVMSGTDIAEPGSHMCSILPVPRLHQDRLSSAHSRSASVVSSLFPRPDEDISSLMMRGATDLRNVKFEVEEQVSPIGCCAYRVVISPGCSVARLLSCKRNSTF